jgi:hypothetical protein
MTRTTRLVVATMCAIATLSPAHAAAPSGWPLALLFAIMLTLWSRKEEHPSHE